MRKRSRSLAALTGLAVVILALLAHQGDLGAASLTSRIEVKVTGTLSNPLDLAPEGSVEAKVLSQVIQDFANGTGANQANVIWSDRRTLTASTTEDLDFAGGGLTDAFGAAIAPTKIRMVLVVSASSNVQNITLFGDANSVPLLNTAATTVTLQPKGVYLFTAPTAAGVTVTATTGDIIQVANGAGVSVTYDIIVIGSL